MLGREIDCATGTGLFELIEQKGDAGVSITDLRSGAVRWSKGLFALLGLGSLVTSPSIAAIEALVHPDDVDAFRSEFVYPHRGVTGGAEVRVRRPDGITRWLALHSELRFDHTAEPSQLVCVFLDVTARIETLRRYEEGRRLHQALGRAIGHFNWVRGADGSKSDAPLWRALTGQSASEAKGDGWLDAIHPDDQLRTRQACLAAFASSSPYVARHRLRGSDGTYRWFINKCNPVLRSDGTVGEWVGVCVDVDDLPWGRETSAATVSVHAPFSGSHLRAARGLLNWSVRELADASGLTAAVIRRLEEGGLVPQGDPQIELLRDTLERAGVEFATMSDGRLGVIPQNPVAAWLLKKPPNLRGGGN